MKVSSFREKDGDVNGKIRPAFTPYSFSERLVYQKEIACPPPQLNVFFFPPPLSPRAAELVTQNTKARPFFFFSPAFIWRFLRVDVPGPSYIFLSLFFSMGRERTRRVSLLSPLLSSLLWQRIHGSPNSLDIYSSRNTAFFFFPQTKFRSDPLQCLFPPPFPGVWS